MESWMGGHCPVGLFLDQWKKGMQMNTSFEVPLLGRNTANMKPGISPTFGTTFDLSILPN